MKRLLCSVVLGWVLSLTAGAQGGSAGDTEKALLAGLKPIKQIEFCPPVFDGAFGGDLPTSDALLNKVLGKFAERGVKFTRSEKHNEQVVDKKTLEARKTTGWMHVKVQVIRTSDGKAVCCRVVIQVQSPVAHPADSKTYVFANLYEDSLLIASSRELAGSAIENGVSEVFGRFCDLWERAHR
jgi:hypothetical protein